jgi:hypothetical protein
VGIERGNRCGYLPEGRGGNGHVRFHVGGRVVEAGRTGAGGGGGGRRGELVARCSRDRVVESGSLPGWSLSFSPSLAALENHQLAAGVESG